ncbi:deoxynucleoside kinase [Ammoniphilus sp. CFH 90114]|uniref:deoxynucleoside kinase n=1 Tax=Ammoniphilus sp. CFH 90114 TaxID=2493665 RepID=UPI00100E6AD9|nr:deoxynucleoside kinase [Ammoniphilus sp. CFH 90114]RXT06452.1 deoxynucleoside kinase [Ammoniphilus sp. CFH 90114]
MKYNSIIPSNALITVAGTVGVGKSTLAMKLAETLNFKISMEKVDGNPYLEDYYADFERWSFHLQIYFLAERYKQQKMMFESGDGYVQDRSIYEDVGIFARMQYEEGNMTSRDYETYSSLFEAMTLTPYFPSPHLLIYLEGSFDQVMERIYHRGRQMEINTSNSFWTGLYNRYEQWINSFEACPVLRLNVAEYDLHKDETAIYRVIDQIEQTLEGKSLQLSERS